MKKFKEQMKRFKTKNLNEQDQPIGTDPSIFKELGEFLLMIAAPKKLSKLSPEMIKKMKDLKKEIEQGGAIGDAMKGMNEQTYDDLKKLAPLPFLPRPQDLQNAHKLLMKIATIGAEEVGEDVLQATELLLKVINKTIDKTKQAGGVMKGM
jgi:hypothetical protein